MSPRDEEKAVVSPTGDETDAGTMVEEKDNSNGFEREGSYNKEDLDEKVKQAEEVEDLDIEAQPSTADDQIGIGRVASHRTNTSRKTHHSFLSKISKSKSKTKDQLPPPVLPVSDLDDGVVGWESQDDPLHPLNFTHTRKWFIVGLLSAITFMSPFASTILAPAIQDYVEDFGGTSPTLASMPVSIFLLGYAIGPLVLSPLSEIYGRNIVLTTSNACFCVWLIGCALAPSLETLIFFRFMAGLGGSASLTVGGAIIADLFPISKRGRAMTLWMLGPMFGPSCAPVISGFVSQNIGWRWVNWITFIPATLIVVLLIVLLRETNHKVLIQRKVQRLRAELNRPELRSCYLDPDVPAMTKRQILANGLIRPLKLLFGSVIVFSASVYLAFAFGCLYILFTTIPTVFQGSYGWSIGITGLVYLTMLIGYGVGLACFSLLSDKTVVRMTRANDGVYEPEMRLPDCIYFAFLLPITFFWYGWAADRAVHWIVPVIGLIPFSTAVVGILLPLQAYVVDGYQEYAASALAALAVVRSVFAAFLPLAGPKMFETLGVGWGNSLLGFIAVGLIPIPALMYKFGGRIRKAEKLKL